MGANGIDIGSLDKLSNEAIFQAFIDGTLASFTFNGIGNYNGINTAYDTDRSRKEAEKKRDCFAGRNAV